MEYADVQWHDEAYGRNLRLYRRDVKVYQWNDEVIKSMREMSNATSFQ